MTSAPPPPPPGGPPPVNIYGAPADPRNNPGVVQGATLSTDLASQLAKKRGELKSAPEEEYDPLDDPNSNPDAVTIVKAMEARGLIPRRDSEEEEGDAEFSDGDEDDDWDTNAQIHAQMQPSTHVNTIHPDIAKLIRARFVWDSDRGILRRAGEKCSLCGKLSYDHTPCACGGALYCQEECQAGHWPEHKETCAFRISQMFE